MNWVTLSYTKITAMIFYLSHINFPCIQIKSMKKYWGHLACCDSLKKSFTYDQNHANTTVSK